MSASSRPMNCAGSATTATRRSTRSTSLDSLKRIEAFFARLHEAGAAPLSAGGDHLVTLPILRAIARERPVGLVHFDAHSDTNDSYFGGEKYTHGTPFRRADRGGADRPEADDPDRHPRLDVFRRREGLGRKRRHPHRPYRGILPARPRRGDRRGAPGRRRRPGLCQLRCRRARPGLRARHRHARRSAASRPPRRSA